MARLRIKWKKPCLVVGTITTPDGLKYLQSTLPAIDLVEVRFDSLKAAGLTPEQVAVHLRKRKNPVLLTLRTSVEGGDRNWKSTERILDFADLLPFADAVDLELKNIEYLQNTLKLARVKGLSVILSTHSITRKLTFGKAKRLVEDMQGYRVDCYKIASLVRTVEDLRVLVRVLLEFPRLRLSLQGIGKLAQRSRTVLPLLGSRMVYGYLDKPAAPGQPAVHEVAELLAKAD
jgi:3-dehydroquinate dehydratase-1